MRDAARRIAYVDSLGVSSLPIVVPQQVHGTTVRTIVDGAVDVISDADGLVYAGKTPLVMGVRVADCVPIVAFDKASHVIGVAHAGWRGTIGGIAPRLIDEMVQQGASIDEIHILIGPSIGACCYIVETDRARRFAQEIGASVVIENNGVSALDLKKANVQLLEAAGVNPQYFEVSDACTSCDTQSWYSFRKDTKETFGEMMGFIGFT